MRYERLRIHIVNHVTVECFTVTWCRLWNSLPSSLTTVVTVFIAIQVFVQKADDSGGSGPSSVLVAMVTGTIEWNG